MKEAAEKKSEGEEAAAEKKSEGAAAEEHSFHVSVELEEGNTSCARWC